MKILIKSKIPRLNKLLINNNPKTQLILHNHNHKLKIYNNNYNNSQFRKKLQQQIQQIALEKNNQ